MIQNIPADPGYLSDLHRLTLQGNVSFNWVQKHQPSISVWNSRLNFIVESDLIVGDSVVAKYYDWYLTRTQRFHSRMGALHVYLVLKSIARRTESVLPDVSELATLGWHVVQQRSRGGHGGGRGGVRFVRHRIDGDVCVPTALGEDDYDSVDPVFEDLNLADNLGDSKTAAQPSQIDVNAEADAQPNDAAEDVDQALENPKENSQPNDAAIHRSCHQPLDEYPIFNFGLTPGGSLLPTQEDVEVDVPEVVKENIDLIRSPDGTAPSQPSESTNSPEVNHPIASHVRRYDQYYEPRHSKRLKKAKIWYRWA
ncbi:hypothetical protein AgCh_039843 [Apium graveolens]